MKSLVVESDPKSLQRLFGESLVKDRIATFYARMNQALRELEAYKLKHGYCIEGISCMRKVVKGRACAHHAAARKAGVRLRAWSAYTTEYGILQKFESARKRAEKTKKKSQLKKAA